MDSIRGSGHCEGALRIFAFEDLRLRTTGTMESNGIRKVYEPSPVPTLYVGRAKDLLGRVPLFEFRCADCQGPASRRGSHVYEINTWLWNFGRPLPRAGGLSVAKTEMICRQSRSETSWLAWETLQARKRAAEEI